MNTSNNTDHADNHTESRGNKSFTNNLQSGLGRGVGFGIGFLAVLIVGAVVFAILNNILVDDSETANVNSTPAHTTEVSLVVNEDDMLIAPGESRTITGKLKNGSQTDSCYVFVDVEYSDVAWRIEAAPGWVLVKDGIYAYGDENMTPLGCGEEVTFEMTGTVIAEGRIYEGLEKEDFKISMKGMAINKSVSSDGVRESYQDYENGGDEEMIRVIEGV